MLKDKKLAPKPEKKFEMVTNYSREDDLDNQLYQELKQQAKDKKVAPKPEQTFEMVTIYKQGDYLDNELYEKLKKQERAAKQL